MYDVESPYFSIIIPVYNAKNYIAETLKSIEEQSFNDYELLLIDDGSSDGSGEISKQFSLGKVNVHYYYKQNGGICAARNFGIEKAIGKYIFFCDHDDILEKDILSNLYENLKTDLFDVVKFSYTTKVVINDIEKKSYRIICADGKMGTKELQYNIEYQNSFVNSIWNGVYLRDFLNTNDLRFDTSIRFGQEDIMFNFEVLEKKCTILMLSVYGYIHFIRYNQSRSRQFDISKLKAINMCLAREMKFTKVSDSWDFISIKGKYIRSFFTAIAKVKKPFKNDEIMNTLIEFRSLLPQKIGLHAYVKCFIGQRKNIIKILLFEMHLYSILQIVMRNQ